MRYADRRILYFTLFLTILHCSFLWWNEQDRSPCMKKTPWEILQWLQCSECRRCLVVGKVLTTSLLIDVVARPTLTSAVRADGVLISTNVTSKTVRTQCDPRIYTQQRQTAATRTVDNWLSTSVYWTQEHKSVLHGPLSKATGHDLRPARDWPVPLSYHRPACRRARELGPQAIAQASVRARGNFLEVGNFSPFSQIWHIKSPKFPDFFIRSHLPMILRTM